MEEGLGVLILVLVEDGLGGHIYDNNRRRGRICLNPCFSGGWSRSTVQVEIEYLNTGLNPCFSGGWSRSGPSKPATDAVKTSLNPCFSGGWSRRTRPSGTTAPQAVRS